MSVHGKNGNGDGFSRELAFAKQLATEAGDIAKKYYKTKLEYITKADNSPVTIADETINSRVIEAVKQEYPNDGVLGEEASWQADRSRLWVCDPIDGTIDFSMGVPTFMFSMALVIDGNPVVAVTADLAGSDLFWAIKGDGAFLNGAAIQVSSRTLEQAWLAFPTSIKRLTGSADLYLALAAQAYQTNSIHGTVFKSMLVAQGLVDASVWPGSVQPWDAAAMKLIIEEAGGTCTNVEGISQPVSTKLTGGLIISNGVLHADILAIMRTHD